MFTPSTTTVAQAVTEITDSIGASGDTDMATRALRSLNAGIKFLNGRYSWSWLLTENAPIQVVAPYSVSITAIASGAASASASAGHGAVVDDIVSGEGFAPGTRVSATAASGITFNFPASGSSTGTLTLIRDFYSLPTDWKQPYTVRLLRGMRTLGPAQRRAYDRGITDEFSQASPDWYDLFAGWQKGKVRLLPPPSGADVLLLRYYRRMTTGTATGDGTALDLPQDYDAYLIAWSKWHFLTDKGDGRSNQAQVWIAMAQDGIKTMIADQTKQPDETLAFQPRESWSRDLTSSRSVVWDYV